MAQVYVSIYFFLLDTARDITYTVLEEVQHNPIKRAYIENVKAIVESEDESDENN